MDPEEGSSRLEITSLGALSIKIGGQSAVDLGARKAEALLVYLALNRRPQGREVLAELLWPERSRDQALNNMRVALFSLRRHLKPYLDVSRDTVGLRWPLVWLDAAELADTLENAPAGKAAIEERQAGRLATAIALYQGEFLHGLVLRDSPEFENWVTVQRERFHQLVVAALPMVVEWREREQQYGPGLAATARWLALDPYSEVAHRRHMLLLTLSGQRASALAHYEQCRTLLADELGLTPEPATEALYEQIATGKLVGRPAAAFSTPELPEPTGPAPTQPSFNHLPFEPQPLLAREQELATLEATLDQMMAGRGQLFFVTGEAGMGKTALLHAYAHQALTNRPELVVASTSCSRLAGVGDPYLPFRLLLAQLTGDLEPAGGSELFSQGQAARLWQSATEGLAALLEQGGGLIGPFLPRGRLARSVQAVLPAGHPLREALFSRLGQQVTPAGLPDDRPRYFLAQFTDVLLAMARRRPLLLLLDDLQWLDAPSAELLFHLGRTLPAGRIMVLAGYRSEEVAAGPAGGPLKKALAEFRLALGDIWLDLDEESEADRMRFVSRLVDSEPNALDEMFREMLCDYSEGNPLMTIETLRNLQDRGDLVRDAAGRWMAEKDLAWQELPARVEGVIEERIGRLPYELCSLLAAASIEGEQFTVQVLAPLRNLPPRRVVQLLNQELARKHRLVSEAGLQQLTGNGSGGQRLHFFRFRHTVIRQYLYNTLSAVERELLHLDTGLALEEIYSDQTAEFAHQLAWHFQQAKEAQKALPYLILAGDQARDRYALTEAVDQYRQALSYARRHGDHRLAAQLLMKLGLVYHTAFKFEQARQAFADGFSLWQQSEGRRPVEGRTNRTKTLRLNWLRPGGLDPALVADTFTGSLLEQLFSGLVELTPQMAIVPAVAKSWEIDETGCHYLFRLRPDVKWHDGRPVTANDFVCAWQRILDPATASPHASLLLNIAGARAFHKGDTTADTLGLSAPDAETLLVELERPSSAFLHLLATWPAFPVPRHLLEIAGRDWAEPDTIVGNGPFILKSLLLPKAENYQDGYPAGSRLLLQAYPGYCGTRSGNVGRLNLTLVDRWDSSWPGRLARYEAGETDLLYLHGGSLAEMNQVQNRHADEYVTAPQLGFTYLALDASCPPFNDIRVRQALALAIDRQTMADVALAGFESPADGGILPPGMPGHTPGPSLPFDPIRAVELLAEAGYPAGRDFPAIRALQMRPAAAADFLREQWQDHLGIDIEWEVVDWSMMLDRLDEWRPQLLFSSAMATYPDPLTFLRWQAFVGQLGVWDSEPLQTGLEKAGRATSQSGRLAHYATVDQMLIEQAAVIPLTYLRHHLLLRPRLEAFPLSPLSWWYWRNVVIAGGED